MFTENSEIITTIIAGSSAMVIMVFFIVISVLLYNNRRKMYLQEIEITEKNHENRVIQLQMEIKDETTGKISRELHDNIGQKLSAAKLMIGHAEMEGSEEVETILGDIIADVRNLSRSLKTESKLKEGLVASLKYQAGILSKSGDFDVHTKFDKEPHLSELENLTIYRICQECFQNIVKHSKANEVWVETKNSPVFSFVVKDNGVGLDQSQLSYGAGLDNMKQRCDQIGYDLIIQSEGNYGLSTTIKSKSHE
jgi:two-component system NarL family sensor kinase